MTREPIDKTLKVFVGGHFIRSESGRTAPAGDRLRVNLCSRKDLRSSVEIASKAQPAWGSATAYLRGQIVYRIAEMLEGRRESLSKAIGKDGDTEVDAAIDLLVSCAGWSDKHAQILGTANQVAGPYHNFTVSEPIGVVGLLAPDEPPLLGLVALIGPAILSGNAVIALASRTNPHPSSELGEVLATSDVPAGVVNILTGDLAELAPHFASHREIGALVASGMDSQMRRTLELGAAENLKRVHVLDEPMSVNDWQELVGPGAIERTLEFKTIWHPSAM